MKKYVILHLDKERKLRYGYEAYLDYEEMTGNDITEMANKRLSLKDMAILIYVGIVDKEEDLTFRKLIKLIDEYSDIPTIAKKFQEAIELSFIDLEEKDKKK